MKLIKKLGAKLSLFTHKIYNNLVNRTRRLKYLLKEENIVKTKTQFFCVSCGKIQEIKSTNEPIERTCPNCGNDKVIHLLPLTILIKERGLNHKKFKKLSEEERLKKVLNLYIENGFSSGQDSKETIKALIHSCENKGLMTDKLKKKLIIKKLK